MSATPPFPFAGKEEPGGTFVRLSAGLNRLHDPDSVWWLTWLSSRDRFNSRLWRDVVAASAGNDLEPPRSRLAAFRQFAASVRRCFRWARAARQHPVAVPNEADVILISMMDMASARSSPWRDTYLGFLHDELADRSERVLSLCGIIGEPSAVMGARAAADPGGVAVMTMGHWFTFTDVLAAAWRAVTASLTWPRDLDLNGRNLLPGLKAEIRHARGHIVENLLYRRAVNNVLARYPSARIVHQYENNPWERAVAQAIRDHGRGTPSIGFLHCAILPSHFKYGITEAEIQVRPGPDRIVCTGPKAREVFLSLGEHDPKRVLAGCDLRGSARKMKAPTLPPDGDVLVVLENLPSMTRFLQFVHEAAAQDHSSRRWVARAHPGLPLEDLAAQSGIDIRNGPISAAPDGELDDALASAAAVVYQSTTVAITALRCGIPVVKVDMDVLVNDDPLFACSHLHAVAATPADVVSALRVFAEMDAETIRRERDAAQQYATAYLSPVSEHGLTAFAPAANGAPETETASLP